ncbi:LamG domain-containing protein [Phaeobacter italicus]|jgi:hypothetical protein|uniref:LamG domain-containing protein n=1 Tax=Phaeobacter italicus TaxID=481446 RepID=UPI002FDB5B32
MSLAYQKLLLGTGAGRQSLNFTGSAWIVDLVVPGTTGLTNYTYEAWIKPSAVGPSYINIVGKNYESRGGSLYLSNGRLAFYQGSERVAGGSVQTDVWQHVACVRFGGSVYLYLDGVNVASSGNDGNNPTDPDIVVGASLVDGATTPQNQHFNGLMFRPRVSNIARYTADFTPDPNYRADANTMFLVGVGPQGDPIEEAVGDPLQFNSVGASPDVP